ncbi:uncharacterized protein LOC117015781 isoform X2 [Rhinolophus ferrumequinum]|nr:uncharacterized protein LOC117015781 isoform X2 [Rhinolophus ferrumequinum]
MRMTQSHIVRFAPRSELPPPPVTVTSPCFVFAVPVMGDELAVCVSPTRRQAPEAQTCFVHSRRSFTELLLAEEIKLRYRLLLTSAGSRLRGHGRTLKRAERGAKIPSRCLSEATSYPGYLKVEALNSSAACHPVISGSLWLLVGNGFRDQRRQETREEMTAVVQRMTHDFGHQDGAKPERKEEAESKA